MLNGNCGPDFLDTWPFICTRELFRDHFITGKTIAKQMIKRNKIEVIKKSGSFTKKVFNIW